MGKLGDRLHRTLFELLSYSGPRLHGALLTQYFDWWHRRPDPWQHAVDPYERHKYERTLDKVPMRSYRRILDVGCSEGTFTRLVAAAHPTAHTVGVDVSARAIERAAARSAVDDANIRFETMDILNEAPDGTFDLMFCAETLYYLGRDDRLRQACRRMRDLLTPGGALVLVHPWPESQALHRYFADDPEFHPMAEHVDDAARVPFAVEVYERRVVATVGSA